MIADLKPYADYKNSGLPWLGQMPAHWRIVRNGSLFGQRSQTGFADLPILEVSLKTGVQVRAFGGSQRKQIMSDLAKYKRAAKGDLAYNTMRMWQGALGVCPIDGLVSPAYVVGRPFDGVEPGYFAAQFRTGDYMAEIDAASRGIVKDRNRLYWDQFKQMRSACPPPDEQVAIVRFLDWANGRLERVIRAKRKVIALLTEQKQILSHQFLTKGVDGRAALVQSELPWYSDTPKGWQVRSLGSVATVLTGFPFPSSGFVHHHSAIRLLRGVNVTPAGVRWDEVVRWERQPGDRLESFQLCPGDIVLGMDRPIIRNGVRVALVAEQDSPSLLLQRVARLRPTNDIDSRYLLLLLRGKPFADYIAPIFTGISVPHLSPEQIRAFKVVLPSIDEQKAIVEAIQAQTHGVDVTLRRIEREVVLLREYRTRLIADVVTGKLDVRDAVTQFPDPSERDAEIEVDDDLDEAELDDEETPA